MVVVELGGIEAGGWSNNSGVFNGQNIQNSWDSHSPTITSSNTMLGDFDFSVCGISWVSIWSIVGMPTYDGDMKNNYTPLAQL